MPTRRIIFMCLGHLCVAIGAVGVALPVVPATPFAILAAYFYSRSSPKMHHWVLNLPHIGPHVQIWEAHGVISPKAKLMCLLMMVMTLGSTIYFLQSNPVKIALTCIGLGVMAFVYSRPSYPPKN